MTKKRVGKKYRGRVQFTCPIEGKLKFNTYEAGSAAAKLQGEKHDVEMRVYYCRHCRGYHLTTQPYKPREGK